MTLPSNNQSKEEQRLQAIELKVKSGKIDKLSEKDIDYLIDQYWLEWTCKYNLSPCGHLTINGKREYIQDNLDDILQLLEEFPEVLA